MKRGLLLGVTLLIAACTVDPGVRELPCAGTTYDGLEPVHNSSFSQAWADPETDFSRYEMLLLGNTEFEFLIGDGVDIDEVDVHKLIDTVTAVFADELAASRNFVPTRDSGANVLFVVGAVHKLAVAPSENGSGGDSIHLTSLDDAMLVVEAKDSLSGRTVYRAIDRGYAGASHRTSQSVMSWVEIRRWARRLAMRMRDGVDSIRD